VQDPLSWIQQVAQWAKLAFPGGVTEAPNEAFAPWR
jgi:hypothetical protein